jgi:hypothetical protein
MSISIEFINLIIRKSTLETKYQGGLEQFIKDVPNQSFREDDKLVRFGCMNGTDLEKFIDLILKRGLKYKEKVTDDFVIINTFSGLSWDVSWLEHDFVVCWSTNELFKISNL